MPSRKSAEAEDPLFPLPIVNNIAPSVNGPTEHGILSLKIEEYIKDIVSHLLALKSQNKMIRESVVAIPNVPPASFDATSSPSTAAINTKDACRTIRNFAGISIPDITSITRVLQPVVDTTQAARPLTPSATGVSGMDSLTAQSPSQLGVIPEEEFASNGVSLGVGVGILKSSKEKRRPSALASQLPPKIPKKRGRPSNKDRGLA